MHFDLHPLVDQPLLSGDPVKIVDKLGSAVFGEGALAGLARKRASLPQHHQFQIDIDHIDAAGCAGALALHRLIRVVQLCQPGRARHRAIFDLFDSCQVRFENSFYRNRHMGSDRVLAVAQHTGTAGKIGVQLKAADRKLGGAPAQMHPQRLQSGPQLHPKLIPQRPLSQVQLALQRRDQRSHSSFLAGQQKNQRLVQPSHIHRFGAQCVGGFFECREEQGQIFDLATQLRGQRVDAFFLDLDAGKSILGCCNRSFFGRVLLQRAHRLAERIAGELERRQHRSGTFLAQEVGVGQLSQLKQKGFVWHSSS